MAPFGAVMWHMVVALHKHPFARWHTPQIAAAFRKVRFEFVAAGRGSVLLAAAGLFLASEATCRKFRIAHADDNGSCDNFAKVANTCRTRRLPVFAIVLTATKDVLQYDGAAILLTIMLRGALRMAKG